VGARPVKGVLLSDRAVGAFDPVFLERSWLSVCWQRACGGVYSDLKVLRLQCVASHVELPRFHRHSVNNVLGPKKEVIGPESPPSSPHSLLPSTHKLILLSRL